MPDNMKQRINATQLPSEQEIKEMMAKEAQRPVATDETFPDFTTVRKWLTDLGIETDIFTGKPDLGYVSEQAEKIKPMVWQKTLEHKVSAISEVTKYLGEEDGLEKADVIIVFGGKSLLRAEKGAELFLQGWARRLLMCGRSPNYTSYFDKPEAKVFKDKAVEMGVPEEKILIESNSINIADNVRSSLNLLDQEKIKYHKIIQVMGWYAQRRTWCCMKKYLDPKVKLIRVNAKWKDCAPDNWFEYREGIEIVFNEFVKMRHQQITGRA